MSVHQNGMCAERLWRLMITGLLAVLLACTACGCGVRQRQIVFADHLDDTVLVLDGQKHALRELAFYIAYEEQTVQEQALLYDPEKPNSYWNTHINGHFVRVRARQEAMNLAIHDLIFYGMAQELDMELDQSEIDYATSRSEDFWSDIGPVAQQRLGITQEELTQDMLRMALAQKYQQLYAAMQTVTEEDCDVGGVTYDQLLEQHSYKIMDSVWEGISMGHVTLDQ